MSAAPTPVSRRGPASRLDTLIARFSPTTYQVAIVWATLNSLSDLLTGRLRRAVAASVWGIVFWQLYQRRLGIGA
jgi:hypothetical protein